jgi:glycolate oxidase FAD binding subunit
MTAAATDPGSVQPGTVQPATVAEAAALLARCGRDGQPVRPAGARSRIGWGGRDREPVLELGCANLDRIVAHNPGDLTAVLEAGTPLAVAQQAFHGAGQWLALDPPDPAGTIGGLVATADSGPSRHRYGGARDLVIGITVALSDGTVASAGGQVIKNVAGYDLGKLFTGSFGTLGLIVSVTVRLHPLPDRTATLAATTSDPRLLSRVALTLARAPLEALCLDTWWRGDSGGVLVRLGGVNPADAAERARSLLHGTAPAGLDGLAGPAGPAGPHGIGPAGLDGLDASGVHVVADDDELWRAQRDRQRRRDGAVLKVSGRPTDLATVVAAARAHGAGVVSRAALGLSWLAFAPGVDLAERVAAARAALAPRACAVLDGADRVPDPWSAPPPGTLALMRRVKARFDPAGVLRPGTFVGGI